MLPLPLFAAVYLLFFGLECVLAVEVRSVAFFSDSIVFLEAASLSVLMSPGLKWSVPGREAFARFARTMILVPTCFMFWMIAANYYNGEIPSALPMATIGGLLLLTNVACLLILTRGIIYQASSGSSVKSHAIMNAAIIAAAFLTWASGTMWPDVLAGLVILYMNADAAEHVWLAHNPRQCMPHDRDAANATPMYTRLKLRISARSSI
jgi:Co/Zn/Cd efflux system component